MNYLLYVWSVIENKLKVTTHIFYSTYSVNKLYLSVPNVNKNTIYIKYYSTTGKWPEIISKSINLKQIVPDTKKFLRVYYQKISEKIGKESSLFKL